MIRRIQILLILNLITGSQFLFSQGLIILEKPTPATAVKVTATQQVILKPGFHAVGTSGNFDVRIGQSNSLFPINMVIADGSTAMTQNIFVPGIGQNYIKTTTYLKDDQSQSMISYPVPMDVSFKDINAALVGGIFVIPPLNILRIFNPFLEFTKKMLVQLILKN